MVPTPGSPLDDPVLADEIELVGDLLAAAAASPGRMTSDEIDEALGLRRCTDGRRETVTRCARDR